MEEIFSAVLRTKRSRRLRIQNISEAIDVIRQSYSAKYINTIQAGLIHYEQNVFQYAYVYLYMTSHVHMVAFLLSIFQRNSLIWQCFQDCRQSLRVCSIGGGPGSDIFGINMFLEKHFGHISINGTVLEYFTSWENTYYGMVDELGTRNLKNVTYKHFDFFEQEDFDTIEAIRKADVITIVKFISTVGYDRNFAEVRLTSLLQQLKLGAVVLFVDNNGGGYLELMNRAATLANLMLIEEVRDQYTYVPRYESDYMESMEFDLPFPQQSTTVAASIWYSYSSPFYHGPLASKPTAITTIDKKKLKVPNSKKLKVPNSKKLKVPNAKNLVADCKCLSVNFAHLDIGPSKSAKEIPKLSLVSTNSVASDQLDISSLKDTEEVPQLNLVSRKSVAQCQSTSVASADQMDISPVKDVKEATQLNLDSANSVAQCQSTSVASDQMDISPLEDVKEIPQLNLDSANSVAQCQSISVASDQMDISPLEDVKEIPQLTLVSSKLPKISLKDAIAAAFLGESCYNYNFNCCIEDNLVPQKCIGDSINFNCVIL